MPMINGIPDTELEEIKKTRYELGLMQVRQVSHQSLALEEIEEILQKVAKQLQPFYNNEKNAKPASGLLTTAYDITVKERNDDLDYQFVEIFRQKEAELEMTGSELFISKIKDMTSKINLRLPGNKRHIAL